MKILLVGASGNMGRVIGELSKNSPHEIVCGISKEEDLSGDFPIYDDFGKIKEDVDILIDFSVKENLENILSFGLDKNIGLILATTGYGKEDERKILEASKKIPILKSSNMSTGVNLMKKLVGEVSKILKDFDIEIVETHHNKKIDAPSGTANMLLSEIEKNREVGRKKYGRKGGDELREKDDIGIHSIRGGSVPGDHRVIFFGDDEILEISHRALSKKIFANGALRGGEFILDKENGLYDMDDLLGI